MHDATILPAVTMWELEEEAYTGVPVVPVVPPTSEVSTFIEYCLKDRWL